MNWQLALNAEILGGLHDPDAEELLPQAIHGNSRCKRMGTVGEPASETKAVGRSIVGKCRKKRRDTGTHFFGRLLIMALFWVF